MNFEANIDLVKLQAIALFAAKADVRYYLNGVYVEATSSCTRLAATNGRIMGLHAKAIPADFTNTGTGFETFILPADVIAQCKPAKGLPNIGTVLVKEVFDPVGREYIMRLWNGVLIPFVPVAGNFPDLRRVIPVQGLNGVVPDAPGAQFNADYLATFVKANKILGERDYSGTDLRITWAGEDNPMRIHFPDPHFIGVMMGKRETTSRPFKKNFDRWPDRGADEVASDQDADEAAWIHSQQPGEQTA